MKYVVFMEPQYTNCYELWCSWDHSILAAVRCEISRTEHSVGVVRFYIYEILIHRLFIKYDVHRTTLHTM
jgi:hypothetical protein